MRGYVIKLFRNILCQGLTPLFFFSNLVTLRLHSTAEKWEGNDIYILVQSTYTHSFISLCIGYHFACHGTYVEARGQCKRQFSPLIMGSWQWMNSGPSGWQQTPLPTDLPQWSKATFLNVVGSYWNGWWNLVSFLCLFTFSKFQVYCFICGSYEKNLL